MKRCMIGAVPVLLLLASCVPLVVVSAQELAAGWSKAHADLLNSNVHPTAAGFHSLDNTEFVTLEEEWNTGGVAHDQRGNSYFAGKNVVRHWNSLTGNLSSIVVDKEVFTGHPAVTDDGKMFLLDRDGVTVVDWSTGTVNSTTSWPHYVFSLYGPSVSVVDGLVYVLDANSDMVVYDFALQEQVRNNATAELYGGGDYVEFVTPATNGNGVFYFVTESPWAASLCLAIRLPQNEVVWSHSLADIAPFPRYITGGSPSLSEDGRLLFVAINEGGVLALNTENGELEWGTPIDDLADGIFSNSRQVPTTSPIDG
ncbi:hypothetical protein QOT17_002779 [Balamuthia mandrillaris]